jgi:hypothetical protein
MKFVRVLGFVAVVATMGVMLSGSSGKNDAGNYGGITLAQAEGKVCYTPYVACVLPTSGPIGAPCWCATPSGPASGKVGN